MKTEVNVVSIPVVEIKVSGASKEEKLAELARLKQKAVKFGHHIDTKDDPKTGEITALYYSENAETLKILFTL